MFVFSADSHIVEPPDLFESGLPASLRPGAIRMELRDGYIMTVSGDKLIHRLRVNQPLSAKTEGAPLSAVRLGTRDLAGRMQDMQKDGIDAEIVFPSLALWTYVLEDPELELATAQVYNDWNDGFFAEHLERFVRCGVLPVRRFADTLAELRRIAAKGFTAAMLPSAVPPGLPAYNLDVWDPVFALAAELGVVLVMHTGTGLENVVVERGPGAAVINYTRQMLDAQGSIMALVAGGVLDRHPNAQMAVIESGASWLAGLSERMDEVYRAHHAYVSPKLSVTPGEVIRRQVKCSFQSDRACIRSRGITGHEAILWGSDYPHAEGTFPRSREVIRGLFEGVEISEREKADILGGTAARLFRLPGRETAAR
jgi:predicted TIM-barrel fold metal-dependent hydrolase